MNAHDLLASVTVLIGLIGVALAAWMGWGGMEAVCYVLVGWGIGIYSDKSR